VVAFVQPADGRIGRSRRDGLLMACAISPARDHCGGTARRELRATFGADPAPRLGVAMPEDTSGYC
jgi:hypothetical protein